MASIDDSKVITDIKEENIEKNSSENENSNQIAADEIQSQLKSEILATSKDPNTSDAVKANKDLISLNWKELTKNFKAISKSSSKKPTSQDLEKTYHNERLEILGCQHYRRGARLQANCCGEWFTCRVCHDEASDHQIPRHETKKMLCMYCKCIQIPAKECINCQRVLACYYCDDCKFWDDDPNKSIYHCDGCGICRIGLGLGIDFFHCEICNYCLPLASSTHKCKENKLGHDCPICGEYLFTSTTSAFTMPCGHAIHQNCYIEYTFDAYQCPICWKSLRDMQSYYERIDTILSTQRMPPEYEHFVSTILCNDCERKSTTKYDFIYHKCQHCDGYNTKILEINEELPQEPDSEPESLESSSDSIDRVDDGSSSVNSLVNTLISSLRSAFSSSSTVLDNSDRHTSST
ncbi:hypothetical protein G9A89_021985 [Geosiphon pyriformis]|nr:hypothetical protein G9A89_021985 [Geosiphon pyriformis]